MNGGKDRKQDNEDEDLLSANEEMMEGHGGGNKQKMMSSEPQRGGWDIPRSHVRGGTDQIYQQGRGRGQDESRV